MASSSVATSSESELLSLLRRDLPGGEGEKLYPAQTLCQILKVPEQRLRNWVKADLIQPVHIDHGVLYFDFKQVAAAKSLCELLTSGVTLGRVRRNLEHLRTWMPDVDQPLQQLAILERNGRLLVRLEQGELAEPDGGQYHFDFTDEPDPSASPMKIIPGPRTASEWFGQGLEQERHGYLAEAAGSYRQALLSGGPDATICFDLANVLRLLGEPQQAMERYLQAVEIDPKFSDAWSNLGLCLSELGKPEEACSAFRRAVDADPENYRAHFNLADTLDELGQTQDAAPHWRAFLRFDTESEHAEHARRRLGRKVS